MVQVTVSAWRNDRGSGDGACRAGDGRVREKKPPVMRCIVSCHFGVRNDRGFRPTAGPALPAVTNEQEGSEGRPCQSLYLGNTAVAHVVAASESSSLRSLSLPEPLAPPPVTTRTRPSSWAAFAPPPPASLDPISRGSLTFQPSSNSIKTLAFLSVPPLHAQSSRTFFKTMYPLGFLPFFCSLVSHDAAVHAALLVPLVVLALWFYAVAVHPPSTKDADDVRPVQLPGSSLSHILPFFHRRFDFINQGFELAGQAIYQFSLLRVSVLPLAPRHPPCPVLPDCQGGFRLRL